MLIRTASAGWKSYVLGEQNKETMAHPLHRSGYLLTFLLVSWNHKPFVS